MLQTHDFCTIMLGGRIPQLPSNLGSAGSPNQHREHVDGSVLGMVRRADCGRMTRAMFGCRMDIRMVCLVLVSSQVLSDESQMLIGPVVFSCSILSGRRPLSVSFGAASVRTLGNVGTLEPHKRAGDHRQAPTRSSPRAFGHATSRLFGGPTWLWAASIFSDLSGSS